MSVYFMEEEGGKRLEIFVLQFNVIGGSIFEPFNDKFSNSKNATASALDLEKEVSSAGCSCANLADYIRDNYLFHEI